MRFLVDAQLPARLARLLAGRGHDVVHTSQLPDANRTPDAVLMELADREGRVVITKDHDFEVSHLLRGSPRDLLLVRTGNISNNDLAELVSNNLALIEEAFGSSHFVELSSDVVIIRGSTDDR